MNILILGENSYIGTSFFNYISEVHHDWYAERLSVRGDDWKNKDFSRFDAVLYTAGIAHIKENRKNRDLYYKVNRDLTVETALKAKSEGVKHYIYISSMSVYGMETRIIDDQTVPASKTAYGKSKLKAEEALRILADEKSLYLRW